MNMLHEICQEKTLTMTKKLSKNTKTTKPAGFTVDEAFSLLERCVVKKTYETEQNSTSGYEYRCHFWIIDHQQRGRTRHQILRSCTAIHKGRIRQADQSR